MTILIEFAPSSGPLQVRTLTLRVDEATEADAVTAAVGFVARCVTTVPIARVMVGRSGRRRRVAWALVTRALGAA